MSSMFSRVIAVAAISAGICVSPAVYALSLNECRQALRDSIEVLPQLLRSRASDESIVLAAQVALDVDAGRSATDLEYFRRFKNDRAFGPWVNSVTFEKARSRKQLLVDYDSRKGAAPFNLPNGEPLKLVDFDTFTIEVDHQKLDPARFFGGQFRPHFFSWKPLDYETQMILSLKKGDQVRFDHQTFTLGQFLGAGNASHIFEIVEFPDEVIKIPFLAAQMAATRSVDRIKAGRSNVESFCRKEPSIPVPHVKITGKGSKFQFVRVSRVDGTLSGSDLVRSVRSKDGKLILGLSGENHDKLSALAQRVLELHPEALNLDSAEAGVVPLTPYNLRVMEIFGRQFLWSEKSESWVLVDWE